MPKMVRLYALAERYFSSGGGEDTRSALTPAQVSKKSGMVEARRLTEQTAKPCPPIPKDHHQDSNPHIICCSSQSRWPRSADPCLGPDEVIFSSSVPEDGLDDSGASHDLGKFSKRMRKPS